MSVRPLHVLGWCVGLFDLFLVGGGCFVEVALLLFWVVVFGGRSCFVWLVFRGGVRSCSIQKWLENSNLNNTCAQKVKQLQLHYTEGEPDAMPLH